MSKLALVIGCGYPGNSRLTLSGTVNDAYNMELFLEKMGFNVTNMNDRKYNSNDHLYPSKKNILTQIKNLLLMAIDKKIYNTVIYFAGHGIQSAYNNNPNELDGKDEYIVPSSFNIDDINTAIKDDEINAVLNNTIKHQKNMNLFMMFDCCHSGTNADLKYTYDYTGKLTGKSTSSNTDIDASIIKLSGCLDSGVSIETVVNGQSQGVLTSSFIHIVNNNNTAIDNIFTISKSIYSFTSKYGQKPCVSSSKDLRDTQVSKSILQFNEVHDEADVFDDNVNDNNNNDNNDNNNNLDNVDIKELFTDNNIPSHSNNVVKPQYIHNNKIDLFGPLASAFTQMNELPYASYDINNTNIKNNTQIFNNIKLSNPDLLKYLI